MLLICVFYFLHLTYASFALVSRYSVSLKMSCAPPKVGCNSSSTIIICPDFEQNSYSVHARAFIVDSIVIYSSVSCRVFTSKTNILAGCTPSTYTCNFMLNSSQGQGVLVLDWLTSLCSLSLRCVPNFMWPKLPIAGVLHHDLQFTPITYSNILAFYLPFSLHFEKKQMD